MRFEGTHTFPATIDRVFAALLRPEVLAETIPGCERLIQLGPADSNGGVTFEARLRSAKSGPVTLALKTTALRRPEHMQLEISGYAAGARISGQALIDLVDLADQGDYTVGAYVLNLADPGPGSTECQMAIEEFCSHLADYLYTKHVGHDRTIPSRKAAGIPADLGAEVGTVDAARAPGEVIALPSRSLPTTLELEAASIWRQRALWMGTGMLIGGFILSIATVFIRWLGDHDS